MKNMFMLSVLLAVSVVVAGCCSMCKRNSSADCKGKSCEMTKGSESQAGMQKEQVKGAMAEINTAALKALIGAGAQVTLVDARTGKFDDGRRIHNALNLAPDAKDADIAGVLKSKDALIVSYCVGVKCPASKMLATKLVAMGYKHVLEYPQGIDGWVAEGNPVTQTSK